MKKLTSILLLTTLAMTLSACSSAEPEKVSRVEISTTKEVEVFDLAKDQASLTFTKNGVADSEKIVYLSPQISGRVTNIKVSVGDRVRKGDTLITLGDSLSTDISDIQNQTAEDSLNIARHSQAYTYDLSFQAVQSAETALDLAEESYQNAVLTKKNTEDVYDIQINNAEDTLNDAEDARDDAEDYLDDLEDDPDSTADEINAAEEDLEAAEDDVDTAEQALDLLEANADSQIDQLNFAITSAGKQYELAQTQLESAYQRASLEQLGTDSQLLQAESGAKISRITTNQKNITAPIDGVVTEINAEEDNLVTPGQTLLKIENSGDLIVKTSLNESESALVNVGDTVKIGDNSGRITSISPSLNSTTKKIDVEISIDRLGEIIPGSFVKIYFQPIAKNRIFIPLNSLHVNDDGEFVKVIEDGKVTTKKITIGEIIGNYVEIKNGLKGNEKIIRTATNLVEDGDSVKISK